MQIFRLVHGLPASSLRSVERLWEAKFVEDRSTDAGGPYRQSWELMSKELMSFGLPLLRPCPNFYSKRGINRDTWLLNPDADSPEQIEMFEFFGKLMGIALRSGQFLAITLSPVVWKLILGQPIDLRDFKEIDIVRVQLLENIRGSQSQDEFDSFTAGDLEFNALSFGGKSVAFGEIGQMVTFEDRLLYCDKLELFLSSQMVAVAAAVRRGLCTQIAPAILTLITGSQVELKICGSPNVDLKLLRSATTYENCFETDNIVKWFW